MNLSRHIISGLLLLSLSGCLTVEYKEYRITLNANFSGEATIRFINILSESDDTLDTSADDFHQLIEFYLQGSQLEKENPAFKDVRKKLYQQDRMLIGEISFAFDSLSAVRIFRYDRQSPLMYFVGSPLSSEQLVETNGSRGPEWMPMVFWPKDETELYIKTRVVSDVPYRRDLLSHFLRWEESRQQKKQ